jgi:hypothetical protein
MPTGCHRMPAILFENELRFYSISCYRYSQLISIGSCIYKVIRHAYLQIAMQKAGGGAQNSPGIGVT